MADLMAGRSKASPRRKTHAVKAKKPVTKKPHPSAQAQETEPHAVSITAEPVSKLEELTEAIRDSHAKVRGAFGVMVEQAITCGGLLYQVKHSDLIKHGQWMDWVKTNCPFSLRSAEIYLELFEKADRLKEKLKSQHAANLSLRGALALLEDRHDDAVPTEGRPIEPDTEQAAHQGEESRGTDAPAPGDALTNPEPTEPADVTRSISSQPEAPSASEPAANADGEPGASETRGSVLFRREPTEESTNACEDGIATKEDAAPAKFKAGQTVYEVYGSGQGFDELVIREVTATGYHAKFKHARNADLKIWPREKVESRFHGIKQEALEAFLNSRPDGSWGHEAALRLKARLEREETPKPSDSATQQAAPVDNAAYEVTQEVEHSDEQVQPHTPTETMTDALLKLREEIRGRRSEYQIKREKVNWDHAASRVGHVVELLDFVEDELDRISRLAL